MIDKLKDAFSFLAAYPPWVIACSVVLVAGTIALLAVFHPKSPRAASPSVVVRADATHAILVVTAGELQTRLSDFETIRKAWRGPVTAIPHAKKQDLIDALKQKYSIIHLEVEVRGDSVLFDDGPISGEQLTDLFRINSKDVQLVVLSACQSFQIGKALEHSGVAASLVATSNLAVDVASEFYRVLYSELGRGVPLRDAFERAKIETATRYNVVFASVFYLSEYGVTPVTFEKS